MTTPPPIDPGNEVNVNPSKTSVRDILARIRRTQGYGINEAEVRRLALHAEMLETFIKRRTIGWYPEEREYLQQNGIL